MVPQLAPAEEGKSAGEKLKAEASKDFQPHGPMP
jgi:hypothetical protein